MKRDYTFGVAFAVIVVVCIVLAFLAPAWTAQASIPRIEAERGTITILQSDGTALPEPTATDTPPVKEPPPIIPPDSVTPDTAGQLLISTLLAVVGTWVGSPLTTALVGLLKRFIPAPDANGNGGVSGQTLSAIVATALWVIYNLAVHFNYGGMFESIGSFLVLILADFGPLLGSLLGAPAVYAFAAKHQVVVLGYQRGHSIQTVAVQKVHQG